MNFVIFIIRKKKKKTKNHTTEQKTLVEALIDSMEFNLQNPLDVHSRMYYYLRSLISNISSFDSSFCLQTPRISADA